MFGGFVAVEMPESKQDSMVSVDDFMLGGFAYWFLVDGFVKVVYLVVIITVLLFLKQIKSSNIKICKRSLASRIVDKIIKRYIRNNF